MAKKESTFLSMALTLFLVTLIAGTTLGFVYELTKEPIEKAKLSKKLKAIKAVVPEFTNNPNDEMYTLDADGEPIECYPAKKDDKIVGTAIKTFSDRGFSGRIYIMIGLLPDGTIHSTRVLEHKETPGLGDKMDRAKSDFSVQFDGKNPSSFKLKVKKDGGDVDAITAATISSRAFTDAVERAYNAYMKGGKK